MKGITKQLIVATAMADCRWPMVELRMRNHRETTPAQFGASRHCKKMKRKNRKVTR